MNRLFKNKMFLTMMMLVFSSAMGVAVAQVNNYDYGVQANIPFVFRVENTRLPAGNYEIVKVSDVDSAFEIHNTDNSVAVFIMAEGATDVLSGTQHPEIVFDQIDGKYFLRKLNTEDYEYTYAKTSQEKKLEMAGQKEASRTVQCKHMKMKS